jgi:hypothetical protein
MSIIIDEKGHKVYKTLGYMAYDDKKRADALDEFLDKKILKIEEQMEKNGLLELKGKPGAVKLWYSVGVELRKLWNEVKSTFDLPDTLITVFIKAAYDNSQKLKSRSGRADRFKNSYFYYCYLIAEFPWNVVEDSGTWTEWVEFLDSKRIRDDHRIVKWFTDRRVMSLRNDKRFTREQWFRSITRGIRNVLRNIDTRVLEQDELFQILNKILETVEER